MSTVLDWRHHQIGPLRPCVLCGGLALMRDADRRPCHKTCAEAVIDHIDRRRQASHAVANDLIDTEGASR